MSEEYDTCVWNETWDLVPFYASKNVIGCKLIFRINRLLDGSVDRYKVRLVATGFH